MAGYKLLFDMVGKDSSGEGGGVVGVEGGAIFLNIFLGIRGRDPNCGIL